jgi:hypothetical protein
MQIPGTPAFIEENQLLLIKSIPISQAPRETRVHRDKVYIFFFFFFFVLKKNITNGNFDYLHITKQLTVR